MKNTILRTLLALISSAILFSCTSTAGEISENEQVTYFGNPASPISSGVIVPENSKYFWSSGSTGPIVDTLAEEGTREKYGDTKTQAIGILNKYKESLATHGLSLKDVTYLRVYVAPDLASGDIDYKGWYDAYGAYFGTAENPTKPARSTIGIAGLANPNKFIEIELVAVFPKNL